MAVKPVIMFICEDRMPLVPLLNVSIVRNKLSKTNYRNWNDKLELTTYIDSLYVHPLSDCYLCVRCQCGVEYEYENKTSVPSHNITCVCGRKVIEYG